MISNRFTSWPLWVSLAVVVVSLVSAAWPLLLLPALPFVLCALGLGVWAAWGGGMALCRGQWRRAISMIALPLAIIAAVLVMDAGEKIGNHVRFLADKSRYETVVAEARAEGKRSKWVDDWSLFFNTNQFVVWDEQDQIVLPRSEQTEAWRREMFPGGGSSGYRVHQSFGRHFYLIDH
jgi:hypothetical protein